LSAWSSPSAIELRFATAEKPPREFSWYLAMPIRTASPKMGSRSNEKSFHVPSAAFAEKGVGSTISATCGNSTQPNASGIQSIRRRAASLSGAKRATPISISVSRRSPSPRSEIVRWTRSAEMS